jgi:hypothetical protein
VSGRALGCIVLGAIVFVLVGLAGLNVASNRTGCPGRLLWGDHFYEPIGTPAPSPQTGPGGAPVKLGSTFIGLTTRDIYGPPGSSPSGQSDGRPAVIAMSCGDGHFLSYRRAAAAPTLTPSPISGSRVPEG